MDLEETEFWGRERRTGSVASSGENDNVPECSRRAGNWLNWAASSYSGRRVLHGISTFVC